MNHNNDHRTNRSPSNSPQSAGHSILDPPEGVAFSEFLRTWTHAHIAQWLVDMRCGAHAEAFRVHEIHGDLLLELEAPVLKEMNIASIGDRIRILKGVQLLRQRCASRTAAPSSPLRPSDAHNRTPSEGRSAGLLRKEHGRPPPLQLQPNANKGDLPDIIREPAPDSATTRATTLPPVRPLPQPQQAVLNGSLSTSPLPPTPRVRGPVANKNGHSVTSPNNSPAGKLGGTRLGNHPYASAQSTLQPPNLQGHNLSPIEEAFNSYQGSSTPSPPSQGYGRGQYPPPSLDDIKKKIVKFVIPDEGTSITIDVTNCSRGQEVIEKVLKKIGKGGLRSSDPDAGRDFGYFNVDGWAVYHDTDDGIGEPLNESQLLAICNDPDHPARQYGLTVRKPSREQYQRSTSPLSFAGGKYLAPGQSSKATKRASAISILSGLGVPNPESALSEPTSPTSSVPFPNAKRPSKLRHFFGQRPPSELITDHLPEYFPTAEKKILRTARHSMLMRHNTVKRQSVASSIQPGTLNSRFSTSTQGSHGRKSISPSRASFSSLPPPPLPDKYDNEGIPRMSVSTEDGHSVELQSDSAGPSPSGPPPQLLPPIPTGNFSDSVHHEISGTRPLSRAMSTTSNNRLSYLSELRSHRDYSDSASMMTVDEITAEVESRRVSKVPDISNPDLDDWTKVENDEDTLKEEEEDVEGSTLNNEEDVVDDDDELDDEEASDDDFDIAIPARTTNKWIKGALIGAGSFGKVYLGMDANNGLLMAVKQVELPVGSGPNQERKKSMLSALETEIELLKNLQHENIVQYLYSSLDDEHLNIFLEYVPGGSVATLLSNYGAFEEQLVRNFVHQILQGLHYLHDRDIIHRDIKGANILVDNKGGVKISDFGISKKVDDNLLGGNRLHRPSLQGSVFWMAPEVVKQTGHTKKADIWSVGCLVVEMLTGEHPWAQLTQMQAIFKIGSSAKPAIPTDISSEAQEFLKCTFEINHELRPPAHELLQNPWIAKKSKKSSQKESAKDRDKESKDTSPGLE
ncbi:STE/STE11 protein kinase [Ephemerocybe angulata]|uniref:mitogen-activated protein kinase kinase kinase n=1 Tax=Ephemerocybe angulata TaxID=980116 RepID=A0A8H6IIT0_9AGAR|nr:STE/STE11 protein kinase [Tulosesus angulatus]